MKKILFALAVMFAFATFATPDKRLTYQVLYWQCEAEACSAYDGVSYACLIATLNEGSVRLPGGYGRTVGEHGGIGLPQTISQGGKAMFEWNGIAFPIVSFYVDLMNGAHDALVRSAGVYETLF